MGKRQVKQKERKVRIGPTEPYRTLPILPDIGGNSPDNCCPIPYLYDPMGLLVQRLVQMPAKSQRKTKWTGGNGERGKYIYPLRVFLLNYSLPPATFRTSSSPLVISRISPIRCPLLELLTITPVTLIMSQPFNITSRDTYIFQFVS